MRSPAYDIRVAVADTLEGITYEGSPVNVYDELADPDGLYPRIILLDVSGPSLNGGTKCGFGGEYSQVIKVTDSFTGGATKTRVEQLVNEILERLVPFNGPYINLEPNFKVWNVEGAEQPSQSYTSGKRQYVDKNIRITYSLTEQ